MSDEEVSDEEVGGQKSEAAVAMQKRREKQSYAGVDESTAEILEQNKVERHHMEEEIEELRLRSEQRKKERQIEERRLTEQRSAEESRRKTEEEDKRRKKEEEEMKRREERASKMADFEKWKNPPKPNFVITKKEGGDVVEGDSSDVSEKMSKEQLEAERKAILAQRIQPLNVAGLNADKLKEKARELHNLICHLEGEKYDLEKRFRAQQYDMQELAEKARQINKVGREGNLKRVAFGPDESDKIQEKFSGCPTRVVMYSQFERQKDKRSYVDRRELYTGPLFKFPAERVKPKKILRWSEDGLPIYEAMAGGETQNEAEATVA